MSEPNTPTVAVENAAVIAVPPPPPPLSVGWRLCRAVLFGLAYAIGGGLSLGLLASAFPDIRAVFALVWLFMVGGGVTFGWSGLRIDGHERSGTPVLVNATTTIVADAPALTQPASPTLQTYPAPSGRQLYRGLQWVLAAFMSLIVVMGLIEAPAILGTLTGVSAVALLAPVTRRVIAKQVRYFPRWISVPLAVGLTIATPFIVSADLTRVATQAGFASYADYKRAQENGVADSAALAVFDAKAAADRRTDALAEAEKKREQEILENRKKVQIAAAERLKEAECEADLQCLGDKKVLEATFACRSVIEGLAEYQFEWTDKWHQTKFPRFRWKDKFKAQITFVGDKIKLDRKSVV